jgi:chemotaxis protein methyltransferase CheR
MPLDRPVLGAAAAAALPLAHGDLTERDAEELDALKQLIEARVGLNCAGYKESCLRRRIAVRMRARAVHSYADYGALLADEPAEEARLLDTITINVSKFFRNAQTWQALRETVVPALFAAAAPVRIWSAGVAGGEEAYSAAILLREHAARHGGGLDRFSLLGTDIDRASLAAAERAEYPAFALTETDAATRARWFEGNGPWRIRPELRAMVRFGPLDLMRAAFPANQSLILCRNVIIYFERSVQETLFGRFADALRPGGFLVLGKVEALFGAAAAAFQPVAGRERIYRRV